VSRKKPLWFSRRVLGGRERVSPAPDGGRGDSVAARGWEGKEAGETLVCVADDVALAGPILYAYAGGCGRVRVLFPLSMG
jgi:hypothetical protein